MIPKSLPSNAVLTIAFFFSCSLGAVKAAPPAKASFPLVKEGQAQCAIVLGRNASPAERHAASELQTYFKKVTGADLALRAEGVAVPRFPIYLGTAASSTAVGRLGLGAKVKALSKEGFLQSVDKSGVVIVGKAPVGVLYGAYDFIESYLGVRWLTPGDDGETFEKKPSVSIAPLMKVENPAFTTRTMVMSCTNWDARLTDTWNWMVRNKMQVNVSDKRFWDNADSAREMDGRGTVVTGGGHVLSSFVPNSLYDTHPEYFALVNDKRMQSEAGPTKAAPEIYQPCTSNPAVIDLGAKYIINFFRTKPAGDTFLIGNNDGNGWCECLICRALDDPWEREHGVVSTRFYKYINAVAEKVWKVFPDKEIRAWGYQLYRTMPRGVNPDPRLNIMVAMHGRCYQHSLDDANCATNAEIARIFKEWPIREGTVGVREYYSCFMNDSLGNTIEYIPLEDIVARDIKYVASLGGKSWEDETPPPVGGVYGPAFDTRAVRESWRARFPMYYVAAKLLWNPKLDVEKLKVEAYLGYFGAAGPAMKSYRELLSKSWQQTDSHFIYGAPPSGIGRSLAKPGLENQLLGYLSTAATAAAGKPALEQRVALEKDYFSSIWVKQARILEASTSWNDVNARQRTAAMKPDEIWTRPIGPPHRPPPGSLPLEAKSSRRRRPSPKYSMTMPTCISASKRWSHRRGA